MGSPRSRAASVAAEDDADRHHPRTAQPDRRRTRRHWRRRASRRGGRSRPAAIASALKPCSAAYLANDATVSPAVPEGPRASAAGRSHDGQNHGDETPPVRPPAGTRTSSSGAAVVTARTRWPPQEQDASRCGKSVHRRGGHRRASGRRSASRKIRARPISPPTPTAPPTASPSAGSRADRGRRRSRAAQIETAYSDMATAGHEQHARHHQAAFELQRARSPRRGPGPATSVAGAPRRGQQRRKAHLDPQRERGAA